MSEPQTSTTDDWTSAFIPIGSVADETWNPVGAGVLVVDLPVVWLVTSSRVVEKIGPAGAGVWVPRAEGHTLIDLSKGHRETGLGWIRHPHHEIAATLFPTDPSFRIKAFSEVQCSSVQDLQPLMPVVSMGCMYGPDIPSPGHPVPSVVDGVLSRVDSGPRVIYTTAPLLPRNNGAPLVLASPYGANVSLAGIMVGTMLVPEVDPRMVPVRFSVAVAVDAIMELLRSEDARLQRKAVVARDAASSTEGAGS